jgi:hypothetical protein
VEDVTLLQISISYGSRASSMRTINSIGSADQGMVSGDVQVIVLLYILSYTCGDRGPVDSGLSGRRSLARYTHAPYYDTKWNGQDTHKGPPFYPTTTHSLVLPFSFSSIKKILYNAVIPARTVLFWCATVLHLPTLGSSSRSHRDAGTTRMTHHRHKTSMTH